MDEQRQFLRWAKKVVAARKQKGWSQPELGRRIGRAQDAISRLESPRRRPVRLDHELRAQLAKALDIYEAAFLPTPELNLIIRGRIGHHFNCMGNQIPRIVGHVIQDIHRLHPDIVMLSLMYEHDVHTPGRQLEHRCEVAWATIEQYGHGHAAADRVERARDLPTIPEPLTDVHFNEIEPERRTHPGQRVLEMKCGRGSLWVGLSTPPTIDLDRGDQEPDNELIAGISHIADQMQQCMARVYPEDAPERADQRLDEVLRRLEKLEDRVGDDL